MRSSRLLWVGVACPAFAFAYSRFSFTERRTKSKALEPDEQPAILSAAAAAAGPVPHPQLTPSPGAKFLGSFKIHFRGMAKNTAFLVIVMIASMLCVFSLAFTADLTNNQIFPVTYWVVDLIRETLNVLLIVVITYFAGALVWKDQI